MWEALVATAAELAYQEHDFLIFFKVGLVRLKRRNACAFPFELFKVLESLVFI